MSKSTFKILFYLRKNKVNKDGAVGIMLRVSVNGAVAQFSSKQNIAPNAWDVTRANSKMTADCNAFASRVQADEDSYYRSPVKLDGRS